MTTVRPATQDETDEWSAGWQARLHAGYASHDMPADSVARHVTRRIEQLSSATERDFGVLVDDDGTAVGFAAVCVRERAEARSPFLVDVWVVGEQRRRGHGRAALEWAQQWAAVRGGRLAVSVDPGDPAQTALVAGLPVRSIQMMKAVRGPITLPDGVLGRPMNDAEYADWRQEHELRYARDITDSGTMSFADARRRSTEQFGQLLPDGLATKGHSLWTVLAGDEVVGTIWIGAMSVGVSWVYSVDVAEGHRGRGYGRAAMSVGERATVAAGDGWLGLNVFGHNAVAIGLYRSMGYDAYEQQQSADS